MNIGTSRDVGFDPTLNMARQALYRFAALSLLDPRVGSWKQLHGLRNDRLLLDAADFIRTLSAARAPEMGVGERPLEHLDPRSVLNRLPTSELALNADYENAFGLLVSSACSPHETEYIDSKFAFQRSNTLADVSGFYHAFGLTTSDQHRERPDHVVLELEFMAHLLGMERHAADGNSVHGNERQQVCRDAQRRFLKEHLAWWLPAFAKLLWHENRGGFYEAVAIFLSALISAERALLDVDVQSRAILPSPIERPEACDGCQLVT